jgi:hypothetical protein
MKISKRAVLSLLMVTILACLVLYLLLPQEIKWAAKAVIDVPICTSRVARKLKIQSDFLVVKDYIIQSLKPGMTLDEVEATLNKIAPTRTETSFIDDEGDTNTQVLVRLCDNPLGNVLLFVSYSRDGHLVNVVDPYDE